MNLTTVGPLVSASEILFYLKGTLVYMFMGLGK